MNNKIINVIIIIIIVIFKLVPNTIGIGPIKTIPPPFNFLFVFGSLSTSNCLLANSKFVLTNPYMNKNIEKKTNINPKNEINPEPMRNGKNKKNPTSTSPVNTPIEKKTNPTMRVNKDNL